MGEFFEDILNYLLNFISQRSFFIEWSYYRDLFLKYFSFIGFIIGLIFVLLVYFSSAEEQRKAGFFKVLSFIAVINCCVVIASYLDRTFNQGFHYGEMEAMLNAPDNIISGFLLTLVIFSCYKGYGGRALLFGIATYLALPLLNFKYFQGDTVTIPVLQLLLRVLLIGFVCMIISRRKYFFTSWIWYFGFHLFIRVAVFFVSLLVASAGGDNAAAFDNVLHDLLTYLSQFTVEGILFVAVLAFAIVFEKSVITASVSQKAT